MKKPCIQWPVKSRAEMRRLTREIVLPYPDTMASIHERVPLYMVINAWDNNKPNLSECYKLQINNLWNKSCVEIYEDNGNMVLSLPSTKQSPSLTKGLKHMTSTGQTPLWSLRLCSRSITEWPGKRCFASLFLELVNAMMPVLVGSVRL